MAENSSPISAPPAARSDVLPAPDADLRSAFKTGLIVQLILFVLTALMLDSGRSNQFCIIAMIGYWLAVLFILARRHRAPTKVDLLFIRYGIIPLWFAAHFLATIVYYYIGESTERGLDRLF